MASIDLAILQLVYYEIINVAKIWFALIHSGCRIKNDTVTLDWIIQIQIYNVN